MSRLNEHIDTIAYKRRAVLYPEIHSQPISETRAPVLDWCNAHGVPWVGCVQFAIPHVTAHGLQNAEPGFCQHWAEDF